MCDICVSTIGLWDAINSKTGEYVAAGKAIVNEKFRYEEPIGFSEGINYLAFTSKEECLEQVARLVADPQKVLDMKLANLKYYREHLRPDVLIENCLKIVDSKIDGVV